MEANKENQQSIEQAFNQALDAYKAGNFAKRPVSGWLLRRTAAHRRSVRSARCMSADRAWKRMLKMPLNGQKKAAEQNDPVAMFNLACYHDKGFGAEKEPADRAHLVPQGR